MKKIHIYQIIFLLIQVLSKIPDPEKKFLLFKYAKKVEFDEITTFLEYDDEDELKAGISYDPNEIKKILTKYGFNQSYNFFEATGVKKVVKDQKNCGCCWSFSATTSLAYRLNKLGENVDLSPQYGLSCTIRDCITGNNYIDSQLNLVKNGTISESCFPYVSDDGNNIPQCPTKCNKETDVFKKYFAKNAYAMDTVKTTKDLYNVIAIIIDELTTNGPMFTGINVYRDFMELHKNAALCAKTIYSHNGVFDDESGHAVTIVGYGFQDNKYYWVMQNSWGEDDCDKGLFKVEFGQINAEKVSFSEPYIENKEAITTKITVTGKVDNSCHLLLNTSMNLKTWISPLNIKFKHQSENSFYNTFCGLHGFQNQQKEIICYYDYSNFLNGYKGTYEFHSIESLGKENQFEALNDLKQLRFYYYGIDDFNPLSGVSKFYVSEEGSRFSFLYLPKGKITNPLLMPNIKKQKQLNCKLEQFNKFILGYCEIKNDDLNNFFDEDPSSIYNVISLCFCYAACSTELKVQKLNKTIHPVFRINGFTIKENETEAHNKTSVYLYSNIEGSLSDFNGNNKFSMMLKVKINNINEDAKILCNIGNPTSIQNNYIIKCDGIDGPVYKTGYIAYLQPYYAIEELSKPFEIIINKVYQYPQDSPLPTGYSSLIKISILSFISFMLLI